MLRDIVQISHGGERRSAGGYADLMANLFFQNISNLSNIKDNMMQNIFELAQKMPAEWATFLLAMIPVTELRGAIPFAYGKLNLGIFPAYFFSVLGNIIPAIFLIYFLKPISDLLSRHSRLFRRLFDWWFGRVIKKFQPKYDKYGALALMLFVAIPLPVTGAWTGSAAAFLFNIPKRKALIYVFLGLIVSGVVVSLITLGVL